MYRFDLEFIIIDNPCYLVTILLRLWGRLRAPPSPYSCATRPYLR